MSMQTPNKRANGFHATRDRWLTLLSSSSNLHYTPCGRIWSRSLVCVCARRESPCSMPSSFKNNITDTASKHILIHSNKVVVKSKLHTSEEIKISPRRERGRRLKGYGSKRRFKKMNAGLLLKEPLCLFWVPFNHSFEGRDENYSSDSSALLTEPKEWIHLSNERPNTQWICYHLEGKIITHNREDPNMWKRDKLQLPLCQRQSTCDIILKNLYPSIDTYMYQLKKIQGLQWIAKCLLWLFSPV